jgi:serine protease
MTRARFTAPRFRWRGSVDVIASAWRRCTALTGALLALAPLRGVGQSAAVDADPARVIVQFKADSPLSRMQTLSATQSSAARASALSLRLGRTLAPGAPLSPHAQVVFARGISSEALAARLAQESDVEYAVPDRRRHVFAAPNDPLYASGVPGNGPAVGQWYLRAPDTVVKSSLDAEAAWQVTTGAPGIVVADVDTGVRYEHPDLLAVAVGGKLLPGYDMISDASVANDGDGRDADASDPGDWVTQAELDQAGGPFYQCDVSPSNSSWHGTQVAGLIAALTDNGIGMASVGRNVRVLPVRALGKCGGYDSDIVAAMRWAAGLSVPGAPANPTPARVINLSLGGDGPCTPAYQSAINEILGAGTVIVAAAGNSAGHVVSTPANCSGVIAVAGLRHAGTKVGFSNLGSEVAVAAPGGNCVNTAAGSPCLYPTLTTSNSGPTTPVSSIYTDSFNISVGTSFATPLVAGTVALMLSIQPSLTPQQVRATLQATARPFPAGNVDASGAPIPVCTPPRFDAMGNPVDQLECTCTTTTCGAGMVDAGAAVRVARGASGARTLNVQGLWWAASGVESGWGINFAHQADQVFATWYTYDASGRPWWLSMLATRTSPGVDAFSGTVYQTTGPSFDTEPFPWTTAPAAAVGSGTLTFADANDGMFAYTVNGVAQAKPIARFDLGTGPQPACTYSASTPDFAAATNYQDLWWSAGGTEPGWGINFAHQGASLFATWYTYGADRAPLWLSALATRGAGNVYSGPMYRTSGPRFDAYDARQLQTTPVGTATFTFADGDHATFAFTTDGSGGLPATTQSRKITRFPFAAARGTLCQ